MTEKVITEYEYNQMLDDIAWAMDESTQDNTPLDNAPAAQVIRLRPRPANDNGLEWPLLPFPDGASA